MLDPHKYTLQLPATQAPRSAFRQVIPYISFDPLGDVATLAAVEEGDSCVVCAELEALIQTRRSLGAAGRGMSPLDVALEYIDRGWAVVPVPFKSKRPVGDEWQNRLITEDTAPQWFNGEAQNIGVMLGKASVGLADTDLDCVEAIAAAPAFLPGPGRSGERRNASRIGSTGPTLLQPRMLQLSSSRTRKSQRRSF